MFIKFPKRNLFFQINLARHYYFSDFLICTCRKIAGFEHAMFVKEIEESYIYRLIDWNENEV